MYIYEIGAISCFYKSNQSELATSWRNIIDMWAGYKDNVKTFNPTKYYRPDNIKLNTTDKLAVDQNEYFLNKCDFAIANLDNLMESPGSIYELVRFKIMGKPVIAFGQEQWSPHIKSCITYFAKDLENALDTIEELFL